MKGDSQVRQKLVTIGIPYEKFTKTVVRRKAIETQV